MKNSSNTLFVNLGASLLLLLVFASPIEPLLYPPITHAYLGRQAAALQPAFRKDLEALTDAPRYIIKASINPESGSVSGQMRFRYTNTTGKTLSELVFRLFPNAQTIYGGGSLSVEKVAQGAITLKTDLSEDRTVLRVQLKHSLRICPEITPRFSLGKSDPKCEVVFGRLLRPGQSVWLDLTFNAQVPAQTGQGYGIFNRALGVFCMAGWYPVLAVYDGGWQAPPVPATGDAMVAETSLYEVALTVPVGYDVVSTGTLLKRRESAKGVTWHVVSGPAREFAVAVSDRFQVLETQVGEMTLRLYTLPADEPVVDADDGQEIMAGAFEAYVNRFGPYPFVEFDLVEAAVPIDGYEFSGMVYVDYAVRTRETLDDYEYVVAHEVAHQWWYGLVGNHTVNEPWLDESLATYAAVIYAEDAHGTEAGDRLLTHWKHTEGPRRPQDPPINSSTLEFFSWGPYHKTVYTHGAFFLDQLREELGDEKFFELLERYQATYRYQMATTADFLSLAEEVAGRDMSLLFEGWFETE